MPDVGAVVASMRYVVRKNGFQMLRFYRIARHNTAMPYSGTNRTLLCWALLTI